MARKLTHRRLDDETSCYGLMRRLYMRMPSGWMKTDMLQCNECGSVYVSEDFARWGKKFLLRGPIKEEG